MVIRESFWIATTLPVQIAWFSALITSSWSEVDVVGRVCCRVEIRGGLARRVGVWLPRLGRAPATQLWTAARTTVSRRPGGRPGMSSPGLRP